MDKSLLQIIQTSYKNDIHLEFHETYPKYVHILQLSSGKDSKAYILMLKK